MVSTVSGTNSQCISCQPPRLLEDRLVFCTPPLVQLKLREDVGLGGRAKWTAVSRGLGLRLGGRSSTDPLLSPLPRVDTHPLQSQEKTGSAPTDKLPGSGWGAGGGPVGWFTTGGRLKRFQPSSKHCESFFHSRTALRLPGSIGGKETLGRHVPSGSQNGEVRDTVLELFGAQTPSLRAACTGETTIAIRSHQHLPCIIRAISGDQTLQTMALPFLWPASVTAAPLAAAQPQERSYPRSTLHPRDRDKMSNGRHMKRSGCERERERFVLSSRTRAGIVYGVHKRLMQRRLAVQRAGNRGGRVRHGRVIKMTGANLRKIS